MMFSSTLPADSDRAWRDLFAEAERDCGPMYDDARRPSWGVKTMGELSVDMLKS